MAENDSLRLVGIGLPLASRGESRAGGLYTASERGRCGRISAFGRLQTGELETGLELERSLIMRFAG